MVGVGSGPDRRAAYNNAAAELARQLQLSIAVDDTTVRNYTAISDSSKPARSERMVEDARQEVRAQAAQQGLPGVTEAEYHQGQRRDYVMVTFDRASWATDLVARLGEIDTVLNSAADQLATVGEGPAAIALARQLFADLG